MVDAVLAMFAKSPVPGRAKTRLCGDGGLSPAEATELYAACVADLAVRWWRPERWHLVVTHPPDDSGEGLRELVPSGVAVEAEPVLAAGPRDFGRLLDEVFGWWLERGARRVVAVSSDVPHLPDARLDEAFAALTGADLVLGPDSGGGCYAIGVSRRLDLFGPGSPEGPVVWSAGRDFAELRRRAKARGLTVGVLPESFDLDGPADVARLRRELDAGLIEADMPTVRGVLARLGARGP